MVERPVFVFPINGASNHVRVRWPRRRRCPDGKQERALERAVGPAPARVLARVLDAERAPALDVRRVRRALASRSRGAPVAAARAAVRRAERERERVGVAPEPRARVAACFALVLRERPSQAAAERAAMQPAPAIAQRD
jgi:hypothetical protein